jgi:hypothetical protein
MIKALKREFTNREKVLLLIMTAVILGSIYYLLIFQPVAEGIKSAKQEITSIEDQLMVADAKARQIINMRAEMDNLEKEGLNPSFMPSYNAGKQELDFLHEILSSNTSLYQVNFTQITRDGNQIRRNFNLSFTAPSYNVAKDIITKLENSDIRCLIGDMTVGAVDKNSIDDGEINVNCVATFYETMYEGVEDSELPEDTSKSSETSASVDG